MADRSFWNTPDTLGERQRRYALFSCIVRRIAEKYEGDAELDPVSGTMLLDIPHSKTAACVQELREVLTAIKD
jgi:hypothetical protein